MNAWVVYESQFGNTEQVALTIAGALRAFGQAQAVHVDSAHPIELHGVDLLVVGGPTHNTKPTPDIRAFLEKISRAQFRSLSIACFDTRYRQPRLLTGSAAGALDKSLQKMGVSSLAPAESFFVSGAKGPLLDGELERAAAWANTLAQLQHAEMLQPA